MTDELQIKFELKFEMWQISGGMKIKAGPLDPAFIEWNAYSHSIVAGGFEEMS